MSYSSEKSPEAQVAVLGSTDFTTGYPDHQEQQPPPYDPSISQPTSDDKLPVYNRSLSPTSRLNTPSTTSLASLEDVTRPKTSTCTKFFISQQGNTLKPWPFSNSNELVTPIYDSTRTFPLYTSTRFKKCSGTCVLTPVYSADHQQPADSKDQLEVHTTYYFGPGNDPVISCEFGGKDSKVEIEVKSKGKWTRSRWFKWNGERYEWRYVGKSNAAGMVLQRVLPEVPSTPEIVINDEKRPTTPTSPKCKGKGKAKKGEENYVTVAEFRRAEEENKRCVGFSPAGQGGWVSIYEKEGEGRGGLPEWLVFTSCLVMLKRERDRRNIQIAMMIGGAVGGGS